MKLVKHSNMSEAVAFVDQLLSYGVDIQEALDNAATAFEVDIDELQAVHSEMMLAV